MNWINGFEIMCYILTAVFIADIVRRKSSDEFWLFVSAAFAGFALELLAVWATDIYHYSPDFYISIGFRPYQFPLFGGLMWGGLTVYSLRIAKKLGMSPVMIALISGWLIVTMDLLLDVAAIRLNGGFWVWDGRDINLTIDHHMFMSVIWVNFLGYLFETPAIIYFTLRGREKHGQDTAGRRLIRSLIIGLLGIAFVGAASGASLLLNSITDEWFASIAFIILWVYIAVRLVRRLVELKSNIETPASWDWCLLIYWLCMYIFCLAALKSLGISAERPLYYSAGIIFMLLTAFLSVLSGAQGCERIVKEVHYAGN